MGMLEEFSTTCFTLNPTLILKRPRQRTGWRMTRCFWIGFVPPAAFPIFGVSRHDCQAILQDVEDRLPVNARTFQDRLRTAGMGQPLR